MLCKLQTTIPTPHLFQRNQWTNDSGKEIDCNHKNDKGDKNRKRITEGISWFDLGIQDTLHIHHDIYNHEYSGIHRI